MDKEKILASRKKRTDGFLVYVTRYLSDPIAEFLYKHTPLSGNQVSYFSLVFNILAAWMIASGEPNMIMWSALIFYLGLVFDCVDGELARLRGAAGLGGKWLDVSIGELGNIISMSAFGIGLHHQTGDLNSIWLLVYFLFSKYIYANITINSMVQLEGYDNFKKYALDPLKNNFKKFITYLKSLLKIFIKENTNTTKTRKTSYDYTTKLPSFGFLIAIPMVGLLFNQLAAVLIFFSLFYTTLYLAVFVQIAWSFYSENKKKA